MRIGVAGPGERESTDSSKRAGTAAHGGDVSSGRTMRWVGRYGGEAGPFCVYFPTILLPPGF